MLGARLSAQCTACTHNPNMSPRPYGFNPDTLYLLPNRDTSLVIYFTFPDSVRQGAFLLYPNYAIWVDSLRLDFGRLTQQNNQPFGYNVSDPSNGAINFDQPPRNKQYDPNDPNRRANFVVYQNPGTSAGPAGATPPTGCARVCIKTSATEGSDTLRVKVRVFIPTLADQDSKDTTNLTPTLLGNPAWLDTVFRYVVVITNNPPVASLSRPTAPSGMTVYPNPARDESVVRFILPRSGSLMIRAIAADGREVYRHTGSYGAGEHSHTLRLPAGVYIITIGGSDSWLSQRLVIVE